ncbi:MAG: MATE family efflux transporter [Gammaproteobacteria bacterium]
MVDRLRLRRILLLALPIIGGMVSQNILNLVDTAMVGTLGDAALAAVGLGGFANFMFMALILGISTGVQVMSARRKGQGRFEEMALPLNAGLFLVLIGAPIITLVLYTLIPDLYPHLNSDPEVIEQGVPYLRWRLLAITIVGCNFAFRGYWNAVDLSRLYMGTLIVMHTANIFLNWVFIFGNLGAPALGAEGAGLASALATGVGLAVYVTLGFRHARVHGFLQRLPPKADIKKMFTLSLPTGIQQLFFSTGFVVLFWIIGQVGTRELAAASVLVTVMLVALLPGLGLGLTASTLVGQALGRNQPDDAAQWGWDVTKVGAVLMGVLGLPLVIWPDPILGVFIRDPLTIEVARLPGQIMGGFMALDAVGMVLMHALLGAGDARRVMMVSVGVQWLVFLPLAYLLGPVLGLGLTAIWVLQSLYRGLQAGIFSRFWMARRWADIEV